MPNLPSKRETRIRLLASMDTDRMQLQFYNWDGERMLLVPKATFPATPVHKNLFEMVEEKQAVADLASQYHVNALAAIDAAKRNLEQMISYLELAPHMGVCLGMAQDTLRLFTEEGAPDPTTGVAPGAPGLDD